MTWAPNAWQRGALITAAILFFWLAYERYDDGESETLSLALGFAFFLPALTNLPQITWRPQMPKRPEIAPTLRQRKIVKPIVILTLIVGFIWSASEYQRRLAEAENAKVAEKAYYEAVAAREKKDAEDRARMAK